MSLLMGIVVGVVISWFGIRASESAAKNRADFQRRWENEKYLEDHPGSNHDGSVRPGE